jgi:optic atrophy 3 protein
MAAALPLLKLSTLFVKTISKPLASRLKVEASKREGLRKFCQSIGDGVHYIYARGNVIASGYKFVGVKPLPEEQAISDGISTLSETVIVGFSAFVIIIDAMRTSKKNAAKEEKLKEKEWREREALEERFRTLEAQIGWLQEKENERNKSFLSRQQEKIEVKTKNKSSWFSW